MCVYPKDKLEKSIIEQIKNKVLQSEWLGEPVKLVNEEIYANNSTFKDKLSVIDAELSDVETRLSRIYDALETGKLDLHDLAPRIKELKFRQDDLSKTRVLTEVEMTAQGINYLDEKSVIGYCHNLINLLEQ